MLKLLPNADQQSVIIPAQWIQVIWRNLVLPIHMLMIDVSKTNSISSRYLILMFEFKGIIMDSSDSNDDHRQENGKLFCSTIQYEYYFLEEIIDSDDQNMDKVTNNNRES